MTRKKEKRIYNPKTHSYYVTDTKGKIKGKWHNKKKNSLPDIELLSPAEILTSDEKDSDFFEKIVGIDSKKKKKR